MENTPYLLLSETPKIFRNRKRVRFFWPVSLRPDGCYGTCLHSSFPSASGMTPIRFAALACVNPAHSRIVFKVILMLLGITFRFNGNINVFSEIDE